MALSKSEIKTAYPLPSYNYRVEIAGAAVGFSEVSGLSIKRDTTTYKESPTAGGAPGPVVMHMPAQASSVTITMKKGVVTGVSVATLYAWINTIALNRVVKKDIMIRLCDENGVAVITWKVLNAFPTQLDAPAFSASVLARAMSGMVASSPVSRITLSRASPQASLIAAISSKTKLYSPCRNLPREMTISISSAPFCTAYLVSRIFTSRGACPLGKAVATEATLIPELPRAAFAVFTIDGYTQMAATVGKPGYASWRCCAL